ncbi:hypothetical protein QOZ80_5BG0452320 [Eleusine coracana subsp. coracana]|nr:hypothetical protein QOZ80_5BG0452320 [Eleusine coracana subsp. coracana]
MTLPIQTSISPCLEGIFSSATKIVNKPQKFLLLAIKTYLPVMAVLSHVLCPHGPRLPANNTSPMSHIAELGNDISCHIIEQTIRQCHSMITDFRKALDLEKLDDQIIWIHLSTRTDPRETSHFPTEPKVYGRDQQRDMIIRKFTSEEYSGKNLSVLVIVGHRGVGKTTLAKVVYNHRSVKQHFDRRLWLHVSVYFDEVRLIRDLLEALCEKRYEDVNLKELQSILGHTWKSNRVLLVLDDVWEDGRRDKWDELLTPLRTNDAKGNTILVTTRKSSVVTMTNATEQVNIGGLHDAAFWGLFKECAFGDAEHKGHRKLKDIGKKIAVKLNGFPLAAKCVGKLLKWKLHDEHWTRILENSEWKDQQGDDDIMPALKISYNYLPRHLQRCFSYCAIFPKNHRYDEERLVNIWIAQGFILSTDQCTRAEEIGNKNLSDLIERGFFLDDTSRPSLLMHDLIHDLAQIVSSYESFTIEEFKPAADLRLIRHVSVITELAYYGQQDGSISSNECFMHDFARTFCTLPKTNLSTMMLFGAHDLTFASTFQQALGNIKAIRVLKMEMVYPDLNILISNISAFTNLRYLELGFFYRGLKLEIPEAICKLYLLQVLDIKHSNRETSVSKGLNKLVNLRRFIAREELHAKIASVGKLIFLHELAAFDVRKESDFGIAQLGELHQLRRSINIYNLQNFQSQEEATKAKLHAKIHLTGLRLSWKCDSTTKQSSSLNILEGLEPHISIEKLQISGYNGSAPSWLTSNFYLSSLQSPRLENCLRWYTLPSAQLSPLLQELHLIDMPRIAEVPLGRLKVLELRNMPMLSRFIELERHKSNENLEVMEVKECHNLRVLPFQLCSLSRLPENTFTRLQRVEICNCPGCTGLPPFPLADTSTDIKISNAGSNYMPFHLTLHGSRLCQEIEGNDKVQVIDKKVIRFSKLKDLQELEIRNYPFANYFTWEALQQMALLKKFIMHRFTSLFSNSQQLFLPESLMEIEFGNCEITGKQLSHLMLNLPRLKAVKVRNCKQVTCFAVGMFVDESILMKQGWWIIPPSCMENLEKLELSHLNMGVASNMGLGMFNCLTEFYLHDCPVILSSTTQNCLIIFSSMISEAAFKVPKYSLLPTSLLKIDISYLVDRVLQLSELLFLVDLHIGKSPQLTCLDLHSCTALQNLHTEYCDMLQSIQDLDSLAFLKELEIYMCSRLTSVQVKSCTSLQRLSIQSCGALSKLDGSDSLTFLKEVSICVNSSLESVELCCCRELERLYIRECPALLSWQGFESFTGLKHLHVSKCPGFVSCWESAAKHFDIEANKNFSIPVRHLEIDDNNVLSMPILCQFTSLETLIISGINTRSDNVNILSDSQEAALLLLTSLKELVFFHFEHVHSLPSSIHRLQTLQRLKIMNCPAIVALPDGGLPLSLVEMDLQRCSIELKELCRSVSEMQKFRLYIKY